MSSKQIEGDLEDQQGWATHGELKHASLSGQQVPTPTYKLRKYIAEKGHPPTNFAAPMLQSSTYKAIKIKEISLNSYSA